MSVPARRVPSARPVAEQITEEFLLADLMERKPSVLAPGKTVFTQSFLCPACGTAHAVPRNATYNFLAMSGACSNSACDARWTITAPTIKVTATPRA
ncbi:hypothetical protein [Rhodospirillum rubrum]|uniref:Uncharacterized protein n=2 Tax=Rhodospirillum rubrum TaxID=1085 RepID=Q2RUZ6_RHORT|nr:hypothetical protein [Rhodospirillum rubrum]ABC22049.1 hypothetical protein Rru_A1248 [Rhodospirillum rubrum ATCC 11170]AEO47761.1 hypothetical protein F11_06455 [Rhodospirillum rubrum F11]MBK5953632.1 hypothetical protein [Rhodospirillum rubrum]QXG81702.1 hypothetical protein KUL73_06510 [Rhodospirillum rubrum]HAQ00229.1 hypothetical protein [Rhodospirillum rubrum]